MDKDANREPEPLNPVTRREWLLKLGETAVLLGLSGAGPQEAAASAAELLPDAAQAPGSLPPGLYQPSPDHLAHALARDQKFVAIPSGSQTDYVQPPATPFRPRFFTPDEFNMVERLIELTLGTAAGAEGAAASGVKHVEPATAAEIAEWIDRVVHNAAGVHQAEQQLSQQHRELATRYYGEHAMKAMDPVVLAQEWREGLQWLSTASTSRFAKPYMQLKAAQQTAILESISDERGNRSEENPGTRLFALLKRSAGRGFYTSRAGLDELGYNANRFYAVSPGCAKGNPPGSA